MISQEDRDRYAQKALDRLSVHVHNQHHVNLAGVVIPDEFTIQLATFDIVPGSGEIKAQRALAQLCLLADARQYCIEGGVNALFPDHEERYERIYTAFGFTGTGDGLAKRVYRREPDPSGTHEHRTRRVRAAEVKSGDIVRQVVIDRHGAVQWHTVKRTSHHPYGVAHIEFESTNGFYWTLPAQRAVMIEDLNG
ncbi:hypothetical protein [Glycomyces buryatensis]|uniref:Uncharacterized protein n=1 Tax=Glycomyces buryatensis TaxID=2570927 RepID=A0A4S8QEJ5_9ACTN|nr:hypothetical protein [Glycomyces buryatensis]THV39639.1 hypothetical protein FAB82_17370 [Glycomyces buryatensis]